MTEPNDVSVEPVPVLGEHTSSEALFLENRTATSFSPRPVITAVLHRLYDLVKMGPTSGNCSPARFVFLTTPEAREQLRPALSPGNVARAMTAPVMAVVCHDPLFFEKLSQLGADPALRAWFAADVGLADETAFRNGTLQGGYLILAARMLGLDVMPMSGFDAFTVENTLLAGKGWRANFLVGLGYRAENTPRTDQMPSRAPRFSFEEACLLL